jgi:hypothetical protein
MILAAAAVAAIAGPAFAGDKSNARGPERINPLNPQTGPSSQLPSRGSEASFTFPFFNQVVNNSSAIPGIDPESVLLAGLPAGTWSSYSVSVDWSAVSGDPWSSEAIWALTSASDLADPSIVFYADPGVSDDSLPNGSPVTLTWSGFFDEPYTTGSTPLYFLMGQTFSGSTANWNNISITLGDDLPVPPTPPPSTLLNVGGSYSAPLAAGEVLWYSFNFAGGALSLDTLGSTLTVSTFGSVNDTEMGLYNSLGELILSNDDADITNGIYTSELNFPSLPAGTYYLAVGGFNLNFADEFVVTSTAIQSGTIVINGLSIPEPATLSVLAGLGLVALRRRK